MDKKEQLKRMLMLVAVANGKEATPTNIRKLMQDAIEKKGGKLHFNITEDRIATYLGKTKGTAVVTNFPRHEADQTAYLAAINLAIFGDKETSHFKSFDKPLEDSEVWNHHAIEVEELLGQTSRLRRINNVLVAPDYLPNAPDPAEIDAAIRLKGRQPGNALDPYFLYQAPLATTLWERIKISDSYGTHYRLCEEGLKEILGNAKFRDRLANSRLVMNLGVGAPSKDRLILNTMQQLSMWNSVYCWVDASYYMLFRTLRGLDPSAGSDLHKVALLADFENPSRVKNTFEDSFGSMHRYAGRKIFFILGFTLSNLREDNFFTAYSHHCEEGDLLVFPMQFIPDECRHDSDKLAVFKQDLTNLYNFRDGQKLARAGLSSSEYFELVDTVVEPRVERHLFLDRPDSLRLSFQTELRGPGRGEEVFRVTTAESFRHFESDYREFLQAKGFRWLLESRERRGVRTVVVERVKGESA